MLQHLLTNEMRLVRRLRCRLDNIIIEAASIVDNIDHNLTEVEEVLDAHHTSGITSDGVQAVNIGLADGNGADTDAHIQNLFGDHPGLETNAVEPVTKQDKLVGILLPRSQLEPGIPERTGNVGQTTDLAGALKLADESALATRQRRNALQARSILHSAKVSRLVRRQNVDDEIDEVLLPLELGRRY